MSLWNGTNSLLSTNKRTASRLSSLELTKIFKDNFFKRVAASPELGLEQCPRMNTLLNWGPLTRSDGKHQLHHYTCSPHRLWQWQSWLKQEQAARTQADARTQDPSRWHTWHCRTGVAAADQRSIWCWELSKASPPLKCPWKAGERLDLSTRVLLFRRQHPCHFAQPLPPHCPWQCKTNRMATQCPAQLDGSLQLHPDMQGDAHTLLHGQHSHGPNWHTHQRCIRTWAPFHEFILNYLHGCTCLFSDTRAHWRRKYCFREKGDFSSWVGLSYPFHFSYRDYRCTKIPSK